MLASALVIVALTVLVSAVSRAVATNRLAKERVIATRLAQETIERFTEFRNQFFWNDFCTPISRVAPNEFCASPNTLDTIGYANVFSLGDNLVTNCGTRAQVNRSKTDYTVSVVFGEANCSAALGDYVSYDVIVGWQSLGKSQDVSLHAVLGKR